MAETVEELRARHEQLTLEAQNEALEHEVELLRAARRSVQTAEMGSKTFAVLAVGERVNFHTAVTATKSNISRTTATGIA